MIVGEEKETGTPRADPRTARIAVGRRMAVLLVDRATTSGPLVADLSVLPLDVHTVNSTADALLSIGRAAPDVVVAGPSTGGLDLVTLVEVLRRHEPDVSVIVGLGPSDGELAAELAALEPTAVIRYPFRSEYLVSLIRSLLPPGGPAEFGAHPIDLGRLQINATTPEIRLDGEHLVLPLREFHLLRYLAQRVGHVVPHTEIGEAVWGDAEIGTTNTVAVHVMRLRRRLGGGQKGARWITAARGVGYQLVVPPPALGEDPEATR